MRRDQLPRLAASVIADAHQCFSVPRIELHEKLAAAPTRWNHSLVHYGDTCNNVRLADLQHLRRRCMLRAATDSACHVQADASVDSARSGLNSGRTGPRIRVGPKRYLSPDRPCGFGKSLEVRLRNRKLCNTKLSRQAVLARSLRMQAGSQASWSASNSCHEPVSSKLMSKGLLVMNRKIASLSSVAP